MPEMKTVGQKAYLTSGYYIQRWFDLKDNLHWLAVFGPRGGYIGALKYRDEDIDKIISALKDTLPAPPLEG